MNTGQCRRLLAAYRYARSRPVKVIVLCSPRDFFSNGIHLNVIQVADDPAEESWRNINAMDDLVEAILTTTGQLTVAALAGNAAAGGLMLALAADQIWCRDAAVLNPHCKLMGLHGSEYWTYTLPRRVGAQEAARLTGACLPVSPAAALRCGLADQIIADGPAEFRAQVAALAGQLAASPGHPAWLAAKARGLAADTSQQPLAAYRAAELAIMRRNFTAPDEPYPELRRAFVYKEKPLRTPSHLARHRTHPWPTRPGETRAPQMVRVQANIGSRNDGVSPSPSSRRSERRGACGDRNPAASVGNYGVGYAQLPASMSDGGGSDQFLALDAGRAQEVHLEIQGGKSGAGGRNRLDRRPASALGEQGDNTSENSLQLL
jgi:enoyl-CoA hydratase/carnithine racemase